jgi:hypothetical protein
MRRRREKVTDENHMGKHSTQACAKTIEAVRRTLSEQIGEQ